MKNLYITLKQCGFTQEKLHILRFTDNFLGAGFVPNVAYFGDRKNEFEAVSGLITTQVNRLPCQGQFDVIVIDGNPDEKAKVPSGVVGVVGSDNKRGLECLMRSGVRTVTCGMSRRDTVTLSSSVTHVTVCLQRRLPMIGGGVCEPAEYVVNNSIDDYVLLLLSSASRLLLGLEPM